LVDARFHAVVANAVTGRRSDGVVQEDDCERVDRAAFALCLLEFRDLLFQRAAGQDHPERALPEGRRALARRSLLQQTFRARILALLVTPDAVVRLIERAGQ